MSQHTTRILAAAPAATAHAIGSPCQREWIVSRSNVNEMRNAMGSPNNPPVPQPRHASAPAAQSFGLFLAWLDAWFTTSRAYYRAAIAYEELYRLSDAELRHRGTTRRTLARDVTGFDITHL
ncbi:MAG TPA: hypothetical protein VFR19_07570 [Hyphomicrobiaceae bacterium]|jgi:hypothetical protein|nr:hypothetical protein [Hyphomicrobiaceae bacterium]